MMMMMNILYISHAVLHSFIDVCPFLYLTRSLIWVRSEENHYSFRHR